VEKKFNINNFGTEVNPKYVRKNAQIQENAAKFVEAYREKEAQQTLLQEQEKKDIAMSGARFGYASSYARSKNRINSLNESLKYQENASVIAMTEMISKVVKNGLLLDEAELTKIYPEYDKDIHEVVSGFLKEGCINEDITNRDTLAIMEYVAKILPSVREGKSLTEDDISNFVSANIVPDMDNKLNRLGSDVQDSVATLLEKEEKQTKEMTKEIPTNKKKEEKEKAAKKAAEAAVPVEEEAPQLDVDGIVSDIMAGKASVDEIEDSLKSGEINAEEYNEIMGALDANGFNDEPVETEKQIKKQIQMAPDGTLSVNIYEAVDESKADSKEAVEEIVDSWKDIEKMKDEEILNTTLTESRVGTWTPDEAIAASVNGDAKLHGTFIGYTFFGIAGCVLAALMPAVAIPVMALGFAGGGLGGNFAGKELGKLKNKKAIKMLTKLAVKDEQCRKLLAEIRKDIHDDDLLAAAEAKKRFAARLDELKLQLNLNDSDLKDEKEIKADSVYTESFVRELPRQGLFESLAVNEARNMIAEGRGYDPDLCLAKSVLYVTITEAMRVMGLMDIGEKQYNAIINEAGGVVVNNDTKSAKVKILNKGQTGNKDPKIKYETGLQKWLNNGSKSLAGCAALEEDKSTNLTESILKVEAYGVDPNKMTLGEKIRLKRLAEQQEKEQIQSENQNLNE